MSPLIRRRRWTLPLKNLYAHSELSCTFYSTFTTSSSQSESKPSRPSPPPIRVSLTESAGRGVFATRRIGAGELIHTAKPFVSHPSLSLIHEVCYFCLRKLQSPNSRDQTVSFCSDECRGHAKDFYEVEEKVDWSSFHDYFLTQGLKYPLLVKRLACMVISGAASADSLKILLPVALSSDMVLLMEEEFGLLKNALEDAEIASEKLAFVHDLLVLTKEWYTGVLARIRINAFRVEVAQGMYEDLLSLAAASVEGEAAVGNAVYLLPSLYNHDCDPNTHIIWTENVEARLRSLHDIEAGEELRICYIDASLGRVARQALLSEGFGFQCHCLRCLSDD